MENPKFSGESNLGSADNVDLCPTREGALRIYVGCWRAESYGFTVIVADVSGEKVVTSQVSSKNITLHQTLSRAMMTALQFIADRSSHREIALFCTHVRLGIFFRRIHRKLTDLEFSCFKIYMVITKFATVSFFCCHPTCNLPGMSLAKSQLLSTNVNNENMYSPNLVEGEYNCIPFDHLNNFISVKEEIRNHVKEIRAQEWHNSISGTAPDRSSLRSTLQVYWARDHLAFKSLNYWRATVC